MKEEEHIRQALARCGYPKWTIEKVKKQMEEKQQQKVTQKRTSRQKDRKSKGNVVIPYVEGLSERYSRVMKKHVVSTCMRPHTTIRSLLVHPKDKQDPKNTPNCIYEVPCKGCELTYVGETKRAFGTRLEEHRREAEKVSNKNFTRSKRKESESQNNNSAITDHAARANHIIGWEDAKILEREAQGKARWIRESIWIRRRGRSVMNRDEGIYNLSHVYDPVIQEEVNIKKTFGTESGGKFSRHSAAGSQQQQQS